MGGNHRYAFGGELSGGFIRNIVLRAAPVRAHFQALINELARTATGSASRVARLGLLEQPPSLDLGEVTDKGSINQRAVLKHRAELVEALHAGRLPNLFVPD